MSLTAEIRAALAKARLAPLQLRLGKHRDLVEVTGPLEVKLGNLDRAKPAEAELIAAAPGWLAELCDQLDAADEVIDRLRLADDYTPDGVETVMAKLRWQRKRADDAEATLAAVRAALGGEQS